MMQQLTEHIAIKILGIQTQTIYLLLCSTLEIQFAV